jgi:hypothetical protein
MVVFGAGASYDSDPDRPPGTHAGGAYPGQPYRPPLASGLFSSVYQEWVHLYAQSQGLMPRLRSAAPRVEQELERIRDESRTRTTLRRQLAAVKYYLHGVIQQSSANWYKQTDGGITNYVRLLQRIEAWRDANNEKVCFVTFNYDTLLERACTGAALGIPLANIADYIKGPEYFIIRLHGSVDWFIDARATSPSNGAHSFIEGAGVAEPSGPVTAWPGWESTPPTGLFPAIAIPTQTKTDSDFICPPDHIELLNSALRSMTRLLIVGWRGLEQHFYVLWHGLPGYGLQARFPQQMERLLVVDASHEDVMAVLGNIVRGSGLNNIPLVSEIAGGFSAALTHPNLEEFLALP